MRKKKNIIIFGLIILISFMTIGYAVLSKTLTISGVSNIEGLWDINITNITVNQTNGTGTSNNTNIVNGSNLSKAQFAVTLRKPGDYVEYTVTVTNSGTIDAILHSITPSIPLNIASDNDIIFSISGIDTGDKLFKSGSEYSNTKTFTVRITFNYDASSIPVSTITENLSLELGYIQCTTCDNDNGVIATPINCFAVDANGLITDYNYACGEDVIVPATVDGKKVKKIDYKSFLPNDDYNMVMYYENDTSSPIGAIIYDVENAQSIINIFGLSSNYLQNGLPIASIDNSYTYNNGNSTTILSSAEFGMYFNIDVDIPSTSIITSNVTTLDLRDAIYLEEIGSLSFLGEQGNSTSCAAANIPTTTINDIEKCGIGPLTDVIFGSLTSLTTIGRNAFANNVLTSINLNTLSNINTIGIYAFENNQLSSVTLPTTYSFSTIEEGIFKNNKISSVSVGLNITTINPYAFDYNSLNALTIPSSVSTIGDEAFNNNTFLTTINVNRSQIGMTLGYNWNGSAIVNYH